MTVGALLGALATPLVDEQPAPNDRDVAIEVNGVSHVFRDSRRGAAFIANDALELRVFRGEVFGLLGPNGAGKTTLVRQMMGLLEPSAGSIRIGGSDVAAEPGRIKRLVGFLPQTGIAMRSVEVARALYYTGRLRGQSAGDARWQTRRLTEQLELGPIADRCLHRLSGGQMRLVNFAMALMGEPPFLILDEPTNELDPKNRRVIWDTIGELSRSRGVTTVLVTHNVLEAERVVDRVAIMSAGRVLEVGTPGELKRSLDGRIKLDWRMKRGEQLAPGERALLDSVGSWRPKTPESHQLVVSPSRVGRAVEVILSGVGLDRIEDFRLAPPSLEDVYLSLDLTSPAAGARSAAPPVAARAAGAAPRREKEGLATTLTRFTVCLKYLLLEQVLGLRRTWIWSSCFSFLMPLAMVFGLARIGRGLTDAESLLYIVSGSAVFAVTTEGLLMVAQRIGLMRDNGSLIYYASLPISKVAFIVSIMSARLGLILPGLVTPILAGRLLYDAPLALSPWVLLLLPLTSASLSGVGLAVGLSIRSLDMIILVSNLVLFAVLLAAPVMIPVSSLPLPLQALGYLMPPTYAADALRRALTGQIDARFYADIGVLVAVTAGSLRWISSKLSWRA